MRLEGLTLPSPLVLTMRPLMHLDCGVNDLAPMGLEGRQRAHLIDAHQAGVAGDIGRQYRRQPSFYALARIGPPPKTSGTGPIKS